MLRRLFQSRYNRIPLFKISDSPDSKKPGNAMKMCASKSKCIGDYVSLYLTIRGCMRRKKKPRDYQIPSTPFIVDFVLVRTTYICTYSLQYTQIPTKNSSKM